MLVSKKSKIALFLLWLFGIGIFFYYYVRSGVTFEACPDTICSWIRYAGTWGPIVFVTLFVLRTLTFFSVTVFVIAAGVLFEPLEAILYVTIGINASAMLAFAVGHFFGRDVAAKAGRRIKYFPSGKTFREHGFLSVLLMYLLFFPFDWVGYLAGAYGVRARDMFLGALLGTFPGLIAFIFLGRALGHHPLINVGLFVIFFGMVFLLNRWVRTTTFGKMLQEKKETLTKSV